MFSTADTIVAIATPSGFGGIGIVRVSGPDAHRIACALLERDRPLRPRYATLGRVHAADGRSLDDAVTTFFAAPHSYTTEDVVELSVHGSPVVLRTVLDAAIAHGARLARPGEFTFRAFLHGRIELTQAEAVADLIEAATPLQARMAYDQLDGTLASRIQAIEARLFDLIARLEASLDFPDEGYHFISTAEIANEVATVAGEIERVLQGANRGRIVREGATVVLSGVPNSGKSSLFNALVGYPRSIVTEVAGTTRDLVSETIDMGGIPVRLVDTAGLRDTDELVELEGVSRAERASESADLTLRVLDRTIDLTKQLESWSNTQINGYIWVINKTDCDGWTGCRLETNAGQVEVSALLGYGLEDLRLAIARWFQSGDTMDDEPAITNVRHIDLLRRASKSVARVQRAIADGQPSEEFLLVDLAQARASFDELTGRRSQEDVLERIFAKFCIGK